MGMVMSTALPGPVHQQGNVKPVVPGVADLGFGILHQHFEVAAILILAAHALRVFFELAGVVGLGEKVLQEDRVRHADGLQVFHRAPQSAALHVLVALKLDPANFDLGTFFHHEGDAYGGRRNGMNLGANGGELASVLGKQLLQW